MMLRLTAFAFCMSLSLHATATAPISVQAAGNVRNAGAHALPADARLSIAALAASPTEHAYLLGAALLRENALPSQARLKAGLLFDLGALASQENDPDLAAAAGQMVREFAALPVTGRDPQLLDPRALEASRTQDRPAMAGDRLIYPSRPDSVTVTGAVAQACTLPHDFSRDARGYRVRCSVLPAASRDDLYVIQPDGRVQKLGIALWNRGQPVHLAPGAVVYVPLSTAKVGSIAPDVNEEAARFLATQVLDAPGVSY